MTLDRARGEDYNSCVDAKLFIATRQKIANAFAQAAVKILAEYFPDCDVTIQLRNGKINGKVDIRVMESVTVT